jgi:hypothetical protein
MREAGAPSTGKGVTVLSEACTTHWGSHGLTPDDPAPRFRGAKSEGRDPVEPRPSGYTYAAFGR